MVNPLQCVAGMLLAGSLMAFPAQAGEPASLPLILAELYRTGINLEDYWVSEKLDGVRAYWDGRQLLFRSGHPLPAPAWFTAGFPNTPMDGELWLGRSSFEALSGIVRKSVPIDEEWRKVRFMLFELPGSPGSFTERKDRMRELTVAAGVPWLRAIEQFRVADRQALQDRLSAVVGAGGEGLMLHRAEAAFSSGRSDDLLKLKPFLDGEAKVVGHLTGKGRHLGRLGALHVTTVEGREFRIGTGFSDAQRDNPPTIGATVTYRYQGLTANGLPRFPVFLRVRDDY